MTKRFGFTLAEVLITLGIIGVVAAMTIPTLISNTNGAQFKTAYKKALSTLNQAVLMNIAMDDTDFSTLAADDPKGVDADGTEPNSMSAILKGRMQSATNITDAYFSENADGDTEYPTIHYYLKAQCTDDDVTNNATTGCNSTSDEKTVDEDVTVDANWAVYSFADGTSFGYNGAATNCTSQSATCVGFIDVNGSTGPNQVTVCTKGKEGGTGTATDTSSGACEVESSGVYDIYPVFIHGQTVEPASDAARAVLFGK